MLEPDYDRYQLGKGIVVAESAAEAFYSRPIGGLRWKQQEKRTVIISAIAALQKLGARLAKARQNALGRSNTKSSPVSEIDTHSAFGC